MSNRETSGFINLGNCTLLINSIIRVDELDQGSDYARGFRTRINYDLVGKFHSFITSRAYEEVIAELNEATK